MDNGDGGQYGSTGETQNNVSSKKLQQTHAQVNEVVDIMRDNVEKVIDRDVKLSELDDRADALQQGASQFETQAAKLKRKYWWKNMKMWIILGVLGILVGGVFILNKTSQNQPQMPMYNPYMGGMNGMAPGAPGIGMEPQAMPAQPAMPGTQLQGTGESEITNNSDQVDTAQNNDETSSEDDQSDNSSDSSDDSDENNNQAKRLWNGQRYQLNNNYRTMSRRNLEQLYQRQRMMDNQAQYNPGYYSYQS